MVAWIDGLAMGLCVLGFTAWLTQLGLPVALAAPIAVPVGSASGMAAVIGLALLVEWARAQVVGKGV